MELAGGRTENAAEEAIVELSMQRLQKHYYSPELTSDVQTYCTTCVSCHKNNAFDKKPTGLLQPIPTPENHWIEVTLDFIRPLPMTARRYAYLLVVVDRFNQMIHVLPTTTRASAEDIADLYYRQIFRIHGLPRAALSNQDVRFLADSGDICGNILAPDCL